MATDLLNELESYWKFDETSGTTAADSHGSNDFTSVTTSLFSNGKINGGIDFTGTNERIYTNNFTKPSLPYSISFWQYVNGPNESALTLGGRTSDTDAYYGVFMTIHQNFVALALYSGGKSGQAGVRRTYISESTLSNGWRHFIFQIEGIGENDNKLYVDGSEDTNFAFVSGTGSSLTYYSEGFRLNWMSTSQGGGEYYDTHIDELALWDRVLNSDERAALYNNDNGLQYPFTTATGLKIFGTSISKANGITVSKMNGV